MTDIEMLPCPFCGGRADIVRGGADEEIWPHRAFSRVFCTGCQARQLFHKTDADAAAAWNTRACVAHATEPLKAEIEALRAEREVIVAEAVKYADKSGRLEAKAERLAEALRLIASPKRPDGTWNRDREACRQIAENALRDPDQEGRMDDLIEKLRQYAQADDLHKDERDTLIAAADALEAAREDVARVDWLEQADFSSIGDGGKTGVQLTVYPLDGDGEWYGGRTLREAIDAAREDRNG